MSPSKNSKGSLQILKKEGSDCQTGCGQGEEGLQAQKEEEEWKEEEEEEEEKEAEEEEESGSISHCQAKRQVQTTENTMKQVSNGVPPLGKEPCGQVEARKTTDVFRIFLKRQQFGSVCDRWNKKEPAQTDEVPAEQVECGHGFFC